MSYKLPVKQEDPLGCGLACISFILSAKYKEIRKELGDDINITNGLTCRQIITILKKYNISAEYKYIKEHMKHMIYEESSIVFIKRSKQYPSGHYLVRYKDKWMDSWINYPSDNIESGFREDLPGIPIYGVFIKNEAGGARTPNQ